MSVEPETTLLPPLGYHPIAQYRIFRISDVVIHLFGRDNWFELLELEVCEEDCRRRSHDQSISLFEPPSPRNSQTLVTSESINRFIILLVFFCLSSDSWSLS